MFFDVVDICTFFKFAAKLLLLAVKIKKTKG